MSKEVATCFVVYGRAECYTRNEVLGLMGVALRSQLPPLDVQRVPILIKSPCAAGAHWREPAPCLEPSSGLCLGLTPARALKR